MILKTNKIWVHHSITKSFCTVSETEFFKVKKSQKINKEASLEKKTLRKIRKHLNISHEDSQHLHDAKFFANILLSKLSENLNYFEPVKNIIGNKNYSLTKKQKLINEWMSNIRIEEFSLHTTKNIEDDMACINKIWLENFTDMKPENIQKFFSHITKYNVKINTGLILFHIITEIYSVKVQKNENKNEKISSTNLQRRIGKKFLSTVYETCCFDKKYKNNQKFLKELKILIDSILNDIKAITTLGLYFFNCIQKNIPNFFKEFGNFGETKGLKYCELSDNTMEKLLVFKTFSYKFPSLIPIPNFTSLTKGVLANNNILYPIHYHSDNDEENNKYAQAITNSKQVLDCLNTMKNTTFYIWKSFLEFIINPENIYYIYKLYVKGFDHALRYNAKEFFEKVNEEVLKMKKSAKISNEEEANALKYSIKKYKEQQKYEFELSLALTNEFIELLTIATLFQNSSFYFISYGDFRPRFYFGAWPMNPQGNPLSKLLLTLLDKKSMLSDFKLNKPLNEFKDLKELYTEIEKINNFGGIDVNASGFQILGLISGCEKTLKLTKFFNWNEKDKRNFGKDFYIHNLKIFKEKILLEKNNFLKNPVFFFDKDEAKKKLDKKQKYKNYSEQQKNDLLITIEMDKKIEWELLLSTWKNIDESILENIFDRKFFKNLFMCRVYSEGHFSRIIKIIEKFETIGWKISGKFARKLSEIMEECLQLENSNILVLEKVIKEYLHSFIFNEQIVLTTDEEFCQSLIAYPEFEKIRIWIKIGEFSKQITICVDKKPYKLNLKKLLQSIMPNIIHHLDCRILTLVINACKKKKIPVFGAHDCFYSNKIYHKKIKKIYFNSCRKIFLQTEHPIEYFFKKNLSLNNKEMNDVQINLIQEWKKNISEVFFLNTRNKDILS